MTIDDNSSIYVGGLPYEVTEESLRRVFYVYGAVLAVKIINDRSVGGKCYGFVTFANPRSATQAIKEMDGKTIDGRVVKVNGVRTRGGRPNFDHDFPRHDFERNVGSEGDRERGRDDDDDEDDDDDYERQHLRFGRRRRPQEHDRNHERGRDHRQDEYLDEEKFQDYDRLEDEADLERGRKDEFGWEREDSQRKSKRKTSDDDSRHQAVFSKRSRFDKHGVKDLSLEAESRLAASSEKIEELRKEVSHIDELVADKLEHISRLREKFQKSEDSFKSAKKTTSHRRTQLAALQRCYVEMRDYEDRLKKSEAELQSLVDSTTIELGNDAE